MPAEMFPVTSSNIAAAGYDEDTSELVVQFKNGASYSYSGADRSMLDNLLSSPSPGKYFAAAIKDGPYPFRRTN